MDDPETYEDILELALERERQSYQFYIDAAESMQDKSAKVLFELLAIEERRHQGQLELEILKSGKVIANADNILNLNDLDFVVDVPDDLREIYLDLLKEAMKREDKSFKVYVYLMAKARSSETRNAAANLAQEEVRHKLLLEIKYQQALAK